MGGPTPKEGVTTMADDWRTPEVEVLLEAVPAAGGSLRTEGFFRDLCTLNELRDLA